MREPKAPSAVITMADGAQIVIDLCPDQAPNTVRSFVWLARQGAFDNHAIERIVPGYVADMSYHAFGKQLCRYLIANESRSHGWNNTLKVAPGVIAMGGYDEGIAGGEFFFPFAESPKLDGHYPAFGVIRSGLEEVLRWERVPLRPVQFGALAGIEINEPVTPIVIRSVRVQGCQDPCPAPATVPMTQVPPGWR